MAPLIVAMATPGALVADRGAPSFKNRHSRSHRDASSVYRERDDADFTQDELKHLDKVTEDKFLRKLTWSPLFGEPMMQLRNWLYFFSGEENSQTYGAEMQQGLIQLWSTFMVMEALLVGVATQPFVSTQGLEGRRLAYYGILWMLSLLVDFFALAITTIFLGYLLANPGKLSWKWLCNIGVLRGVPSLLVVLATFMSLLAIAFTTFILYGWKVGIGCTILVALLIATCIWCSILLSYASTQLIEGEKALKKKAS